MRGGCIPGIAGPGISRRGHLLPPNHGNLCHEEEDGAMRHHHHRLGGDLEPGDGLVGRALWAGGGSAVVPDWPRSEESVKRGWQ